MKKLTTIFFFLLIPLSMTSCQMSSKRNGASQDELSPIDNRKHEESRARATANRVDAILQSNGSVYKDSESTAYLQSVMNRLYPLYKAHIKVRILKDTRLNAFSLANGSIYFNLGLIARLQNEAQLATVLGHEGAHYIKKHSLKQRLKLKSISVTPYRKNAIYGYSRSLERAADYHAFLSLKKAGYNTAEASRVFEYLSAEVKLLQGEKNVHKRLHPRLAERIANFRRLHKKYGVSHGKSLRNIYNRKTRNIKVADLEENLSSGNYKSVILILANKDIVNSYPKFYSYYLGEAYRLRGGNLDKKSAERAYIQSTRNAPRFSLAYNALGVHYLKSGKYRKAKQYFIQYLKLDPRGKNAAYANHYIMNIDSDKFRGIK